MKKVKKMVHKSNNSLCKMFKNEKSEFLSMDLIERMIRIEQRVSSSFNKPVSYDKTEYYRSLTDDEKKRFERYLIKNKRKKFLLGLLLAIPMLFLITLKIELTGKAITDFVGNSLPAGILENGAVLLILSMCAVYLLGLFLRRLKDKRYDSHFNVLERAYIDKYTIRHLN